MVLTPGDISEILKSYCVQYTAEELIASNGFNVINLDLFSEIEDMVSARYIVENIKNVPQGTKYFQFKNGNLVSPADNKNWTADKLAFLSSMNHIRRESVEEVVKECASCTAELDYVEFMRIYDEGVKFFSGLMDN